MTAHTVIVAQTRVGFLTGGRKQSFRDLLQEEQSVQQEEAFARATVAITRARSLCLIMGPLIWKGFLGLLGHRISHVWSRTSVSRPLSFTWLLNWRFPHRCSVYPDALSELLSGWTGLPTACCVEVLKDYVTHIYKVRRLHLIVVDLWRPWRYNARRAKQITDQLWFLRNKKATKRMVPLICQLVMTLPFGAADMSIWICSWECRISMLLDLAGAVPRPQLSCSWYLDWGRLSFGGELFFPASGIQHFYDAFAFESHLSTRQDALTLFGLEEDELPGRSQHCIVSSPPKKMGWSSGAPYWSERPGGQSPTGTSFTLPLIKWTLTQAKGEQAPSSQGSQNSSTELDALAEEHMPSPLADDLEQYDLTQDAYGEVGHDFVIRNEWLVGLRQTSAFGGCAEKVAIG